MGIVVGLMAAMVSGCRTLHGYGPAALMGLVGSGVGFMAARALNMNGPHDRLGFLWSVLGAAVVAYLWCKAVRQHRV
jgi:uncharacterized membrane protein YeaQ/YmgE (transglycosylase-associated protein family)